MMVKFSILVLFFFILLCSCNNKNKDLDLWQKTTNRAVGEWIGNEMTLPKENIDFINKPRNYNSVKGFVNEKSNKIVAHIDGNCSACVNSLFFWQKMSEKVSSLKINCSFLLYIHTENKDLFKKDVIESLKIDVPCLFDEEASFKNLNGLHDQRLQAALLDIENKVILIGNPVLNETLSELYLETLKGLKQN